MTQEALLWTKGCNHLAANAGALLLPVIASLAPNLWEYCNGIFTMMSFVFLPSQYNPWMVIPLVVFMCVGPVG